MTQEKPERKKGLGDVRAGAALILIGLLLVLQRIGWISLTNWWALFILIPAASALWGGMGLWRKNGRFDAAVWSTFQGGLFPLLVAIVFLFDLSWALYWPLLVILAGFCFLTNGLMQLVSPGDNPDRVWRRYRAWQVFVGIGALVLGFGFLGQTTGLFDPTLFGRRWWAWCMLIPALGGVVTALRLSLAGRLGAETWINLAAAAVIAMPGVVAIAGISWNLIVPLTIIAVGVVLLLWYAVGRRESD